MEIKPIITLTDYEAALEEIGQLFQAAPSTPEGDHLEVLATLVEVYENQHYTLPPPDPIEAILYYMETRGLGKLPAGTGQTDTEGDEKIQGRKNSGERI